MSRPLTDVADLARYAYDVPYRNIGLCAIYVRACRTLVVDKRNSQERIRDFAKEAGVEF